MLSFSQTQRLCSLAAENTTEIALLKAGYKTMIIALVSALISSLALAGVALSLLLQARQVKIAQLETTRTAQLELIKMALDNPEMAAAALGIADSDQFVKEVFLNWHMKYYELGYEIGALSEVSLRRDAVALFSSDISREWWTYARRGFQADIMTRRQKQFFVIVDGEFQRIQAMSKTYSDPTQPETGPP